MNTAFALRFLFIYFHDQLVTSAIKYIFINEIAMYEVGLLRIFDLRGLAL
jgi:hypothetical protein